MQTRASVPVSSPFAQQALRSLHVHVKNPSPSLDKENPDGRLVS